MQDYLLPPVAISDLPQATVANPTDQIEVNQGGTSRSIRVEQITTVAVQGGAFPIGPAGGALTGNYPNPQLAALSMPPSGPAGGALSGTYPNPQLAVPYPVTLPPNGPAGGALTGTYPNPQLAVPYPTTLPPNGPAGGDLTGTYPNPQLVGGPLSNYATTASLAGYLPLTGGTLSGDVFFNASVTMRSYVDIVQPTGFGVLQISGPSGAYVDLASPSTDDFDLRVVSYGAGGSILANSAPLILETLAGDYPINIVTNGVQRASISSAALQLSVPLTGTSAAFSSSPYAIAIYGASGTNRTQIFASGILPRWNFMVSSEAESGGNAGSNFYISSFADDGSFIAQPFVINRATGLVSANFGIASTMMTLSGTIPPASNDTTVPTTAWVRANTGGAGVYLPLTGGTINPGNLNVGTPPAAGVVLYPLGGVEIYGDWTTKGYLGLFNAAGTPNQRGWAIQPSIVSIGGAAANSLGIVSLSDAGALQKVWAFQQDGNAVFPGNIRIADPNVAGMRLESWGFMTIAGSGVGGSTIDLFRSDAAAGSRHWLMSNVVSTNNFSIAAVNDSFGTLKAWNFNRDGTTTLPGTLTGTTATFSSSVNLTGAEDDQLRITNGAQSWHVNNSASGSFYLLDATNSKFPLSIFPNPTAGIQIGSNIALTGPLNGTSATFTSGVVAVGLSFPAGGGINGTAVFTQLITPDNQVAIYLGGSVDQQTYHRNTAHRFQSLDGTVDFATLNASSFVVPLDTVFGKATGRPTMAVRGGDSAAADGALLAFRNGATDNMYIGNVSGVFGGAYSPNMGIITQTGVSLMFALGLTQTHTFGTNGSLVVTGPLTALSGTAVAAGANTQAFVKASSTANLGIYYGTGAPTFTAAKGSFYSNTAATTTTTRLYVNTDGGTTWASLTTSA